MVNPFINDESDISERMIWKYMNMKNICSIAKVTGINSSPVSVNIQPLVNFFDRVNGYTEFEELEDVPCSQMQTTIAGIKMPLNVGDLGYVLWVDREIYTTLIAGGLIPQDPSAGDLCDPQACIFVPFLTSFAVANAINTAGIDIISSSVSLLTQLSNLASELNNVASQLADTANLTGTSSCVDGGPLSNATDLVEIATIKVPAIQLRIDTISSQLTLFKGQQ